MKRHESLAPLSREHHGALILAQLLKKATPAYKGMPTTDADKIIYAVTMYNDSLKEHFKKEELLLQKVGHYHEDIAKLGKEIVAEHRHLTESFLALDRAANPVDAMNDLGNALDTHIRKEERLLFPMIQKYCPEEAMEEIRFLLQ